MTDINATAFFRQAAWSDEEGLSDKTRAAADQAEGDWHTHRQYLAEDHMNAHLLDEETNRLAHQGHAQRTADRICDTEGMPRIKVHVHPSSSVSGRGTTPDGSPAVVLGENSLKHTTLIHELTHHKRQPAEDDPDHSASGFYGDYIGMLQRHHPQADAWEHMMTANRLAVGHMRAHPDNFPPRTASAAAYDAPEGGPHGRAARAGADRPGDRGRTAAQARDGRRPQPGQPERAARQGRRVRAASAVDPHPELQGDLNRLGGGARHVQDTINALQHGRGGVTTYPLSHPLDGWHAAITSGGHQVVHRHDPDTKTLHVGYAGHNTAEAEARLGGSGGSETNTLPVEFHKGAEKDFDKLHPEVQDRVLDTIDRLSRREPHPHDHALTGPLKGWGAARADFLNRVTHRYEDEHGTPPTTGKAARLFIGHVGPHNYDDAIKRLTSLTAFFREASLPKEWFHGSGAAFDQFDLSKNKTVQDEDDAKHWNSHLGAHFTSDHRVAQEFAQRQGGGHVYHAQLHLQNPKHYDSEHDLDKEAVLWAHANGHDMGPSVSKPAYRANIEPDEWQFHVKYDDHGEVRPEARAIAHGFRDHLKAQGHDGITYGNEFEGANNGFHAGERHLSAIAFHPDQIAITQRHGGDETHTSRTSALRFTDAEERLIQRQAAAVAHDDGVMVAFVPPRETAEQLALQDGQPVDDLHITMAYLGNAADYTREQLKLLPQVVGAWAVRHKPVTIRIGGVGKFNNAFKDQYVLWAAADIPGGAQMHADLARYLEGHGYRLPSEHGWTPHMTLRYVDQHFRFMPHLDNHRWEASEVVTFVRGERHPARFGGRPSTPTTL